MILTLARSGILCYTTPMNIIFVSEKANPILLDYLALQGLVVTVGAIAKTDPAVSSHPDICMCRIGDRLIMAPAFLSAASATEAGRTVIIRDPRFSVGDTSPYGAYPGDIPYNAACFGRFFMHSLKHTDPAVLQHAAEKSLTPINVRQGYTKCNTVIVDDSSIITSDRGIALAAGRHGIDVLEIAPGHVRLDGHPCGFLGGASVRIGSQVVFNGDLSRHPDFEAICGFIALRGLQTLFFEEYTLEDIGSVIVL